MTWQPSRHNPWVLILPYADVGERRRTHVQTMNDLHHRDLIEHPSHYPVEMDGIVP